MLEIDKEARILVEPKWKENSEVHNYLRHPAKPVIFCYHKGKTK